MTPTNDQIVVMAKAVIDDRGAGAADFADAQLAACAPGDSADTWHRITAAISLATMPG